MFTLVLIYIISSDPVKDLNLDFYCIMVAIVVELLNLIGWFKYSYEGRGSAALESF